MATSDEEVRQPRIRVGALIVQDGCALMAQHTKAGRSYWMLPGGGVDYGESLTEALTRELREECCVEIAVRELIFVQDSIAPDASRHILHLVFAAHILSGTPEVGEDPRVTGVQFLNADALRDQPLYPDMARPLVEYLRDPEVGRTAYLGNAWLD